MNLINYTSEERDLLARLMRAEAVGEGEMGMLMVGNVGVNRALANCFTFKNIRTISDVINQVPGGFSGISSPLFYSKPTTEERNLADRVLKGEYFHPATNSLWFYAPQQGTNCSSYWYNQPNAGRYKNHCFYEPDPNECQKFH